MLILILSMPWLHPLTELHSITVGMFEVRISKLAKFIYKFGTTNGHPFRVRPLPSDPRTVAKARTYYENQLKDYPDVLDVADIVAFTGYNRRTVAQWMRLDKLKALQLPNKYIVPKSYLIDWFVSEPYNQTHRKSIQHSKII